MLEITVLSGKGGTGKTCISAGLASVAKNTVFCDNDVDAADLHLIFKPQNKENHQFLSGTVARINAEKCNNCGLCKSYCRFNAIHNINGIYHLNPYQCEGCRLCEHVCPEKAISSEQSLNNHWYVANTRFGTFVHAKMGPGEENSGKLVSHIRKRSKEIAIQENARFILNDGPPGIGCAAISSLSGIQIALLVIEPTLSGLHDIKRLIHLIKSFKIKAYAIINKFDINQTVTEKIERYLQTENIELISKIPFDTSMIKAMVNQQTIIEYQPDSVISEQIKSIWDRISKVNTYQIIPEKNRNKKKTII